MFIARTGGALFADVDKIPPVSGANAIPIQKLVFDWIFF
jgi:hypothetical protein